MHRKLQLRMMTMDKKNVQTDLFFHASWFNFDNFYPTSETSICTLL